MLFDPRFLITLYRCSYSSFPPLGCAFGFWFWRPSFWGCQTHGARNTTKLCTGARSMDSFISFHNQNNQTIRIQQSWTNNHGFVSAFRNKKIPSEVQTSVTRLLKAQLSQAVQDLFETSRIHWQSVISIDFPHDATNFGRNSLEPTVLSFRWEHPVVFYFDSWVRLPKSTSQGPHCPFQ